MFDQIKCPSLSSTLYLHIPNAFYTESTFFTNTLSQMFLGCRKNDEKLINTVADNIHTFQAVQTPIKIKYVANIIQ